MPNKNRYDGMIDKTYLYNAEQHTIQRIEPADGELVDVYTDKRRIRLTRGELKELFLPVNVPIVRVKDSIMLAEFKEQSKPMGDLVSKLDKLIDNIDKDPAYIAKAKAINETARSIVMTWKSQIELLKVMKG